MLFMQVMSITALAVRADTLHVVVPPFALELSVLAHPSRLLWPPPWAKTPWHMVYAPPHFQSRPCAEDGIRILDYCMSR